MTDAQDLAVSGALRTEFERLVAAHDDFAVHLFRGAGVLGFRDALPYELLPDYSTSDTESPWRISDNGVVRIENGTEIGHVWATALDTNRFNFSCMSPACPANLDTYPRRIEAAAAAEDHRLRCPANHP